LVGAFSFLGLAAFGPAMLWMVWVNIRFLRCCGWRFRPYGDSLFLQTPKKVSKKTLAPTFGPRRLGSLRSGTDPGAAAPVCFAAPPSAVSGCARRSLRSHTRINPSAQPSDVAGGSRSRALELALIVEWGGCAAGSCAALPFCGSEPAREGGLAADLSLGGETDSGRSFDQQSHRPDGNPCPLAITAAYSVNTSNPATIHGNAPTPTSPINNPPANPPPAIPTFQSVTSIDCAVSAA